MNTSIPFHLVAPTLIALTICGLGALVGSMLSRPAAQCLHAPIEEDYMDAYPYGCYGALRYEALRQAAPSCTPDVNRQAKGDAR